MRSQPPKNKPEADNVETPYKWALAIVNHFKPTGHVLDPCSGMNDRFLKALRFRADLSGEISTIHSCELRKGRCFLEDWKMDGINWIITNPPWSKIREFLVKGMEVSENIVYLVTANHLYTHARQRDMWERGYGIAEIVYMPKIKEFPQSGFQLVAVHIKKGHHGEPTRNNFDLLPRL